MSNDTSLPGPEPIYTAVPIFALVIGIDNYPRDKLEGAVSDADEVDKYLQHNLGVPTDHIINLRGEAAETAAIRDASYKFATRENIIEGFRALQKDHRINHGDAIFIYFAGHGSETTAPDGWHAGRNMIQLVVPQDVGTKLSSGQTVHEIPDRTVNALLNNLAEKKGNNITVIFDCCHSASMARDHRKSTKRGARFTKAQGELPSEVDEDIIKNQDVDEGNGKSRGAKIATGFLQRDLRSHVLLAACGAEESAWEKDKHGVFTKAFLEVLRATSAHSMTYTELIRRLPLLSNQNPQCEGHNRGCFFFSLKDPHADASFINVAQEGANYILQAGKAQGITIGSKFAIYANNDMSPDNEPQGTLRVKALEDTRAMLEPLGSVTAHWALPKPAYARQASGEADEKLNVYFTDALTAVIRVEKILGTDLDADELVDMGFRVATADKAELLVDIDEDKRRAIFATGIPRANAEGLKDLPHSVDATPRSISRVLRSAALWHWHFRRENTSGFSGQVHLEFTRLQKSKDEYDNKSMPVTKPLGDNMNYDGVVRIPVHKDHIFGLKLINNSNYDLYPYVFYFDVGELSIDPHYLCAVGNNMVDAPLPAKSCLTIGYGDGGSVPLMFELEDDQTKDVGFLKVFLTTTKADFGSLKQKSPFARAPKRKKQVIQELRRADWDSVTVTLVQHT